MMIDLWFLILGSFVAWGLGWMMGSAHTGVLWWRGSVSNAQGYWKRIDELQDEIRALQDQLSVEQSK